MTCTDLMTGGPSWRKGVMAVVCCIPKERWCVGRPPTVDYVARQSHNLLQLGLTFSTHATSHAMCTHKWYVAVRELAASTLPQQPPPPPMMIYSAPGRTSRELALPRTLGSPSRVSHSSFKLAAALLPLPGVPAVELSTTKHNAAVSVNGLSGPAHATAAHTHRWLPRQPQHPRRRWS